MQMTEKHNAKEIDNKKSVQKIKISFQPNDECVYGDIPTWFTMFPSLCRDRSHVDEWVREEINLKVRLRSVW